MYRFRDHGISNLTRILQGFTDMIAHSRTKLRKFLAILSIANALLIPTVNTLVQAEDQISLGLATVLTGENAPTGLDVRDAIEFANKKFANGLYKLIIEDDRCLGKDGVNIASKFIDIDKIQAALGFACSSAFLPAAPLYEKAHVIAMVSCASSPKIAQAGDYIFRTALEDGTLGKKLAEYVGAHHSKVAVLSEASDFSQDLLEVFQNTLENKKISVANEDFISQSADFRPQLLRLRSKAAEALFINAQAEKTFAIILRQLKEMKWTPHTYGAYWPGSPALLEIARNELEGIVYADTPSLDEMLNKEGRKLLEEYRKGGGEIRSTEAMWASSIEAFRALHEAISSGDDVKHYLYHHQFHGIFGDYRFDGRGEITGVYPVLKTIRHGTPTILKE